jgi:tryptophan-rich sensory protein
MVLDLLRPQDAPGAAFLELVLLWAAIAATIRAFARVDRVAAWMMGPYIGWVTFAGALNASIWFLNR